MFWTDILEGVVTTSGACSSGVATPYATVYHGGSVGAGAWVKKYTRTGDAV